MCNKAVCMDTYSLEFVPGHHKTQEMWDEAVHREPYTLRYVPDHHKAVGRDPCIFSDRFKVEDICNETVHRKPYTLRCVHGPCLLRYVLDHLKTQEAYSRVVEKFFYHLICILTIKLSKNFPKNL